MGAKYDLKDFPIFLQDLAKKHKEAAQKGALSAGVKLIEVITTRIIPATVPTPVDRVIYRAGWRFKPIKDGVYVYNASNHGLFVEYGVRAIKPSKKLLKALMAWIRRKGIGSKVIRGTNKKGEAFVKIKKPGKAEIESIAWAIIKGAQKKGGFFRQGKGLGVFKAAMKVAPQIFRDEVYAAIRKEMS